MHVIWFILFGLIVGWVARFLMPGPQSMGLILTSILGMAGSFIGALLANLIRRGTASFEAADPFNWIAAVVGSLLLLFIVRRATGRTM